MFCFICIRPANTVSQEGSEIFIHSYRTYSLFITFHFVTYSRSISFGQFKKLKVKNEYQILEFFNNQLDGQNIIPSEILISSIKIFHHYYYCFLSLEINTFIKSESSDQWIDRLILFWWMSRLDPLTNFIILKGIKYSCDNKNRRNKNSSLLRQSSIISIIV